MTRCAAVTSGRSFGISTVAYANLDGIEHDEPSRAIAKHRHVVASWLGGLTIVEGAMKTDKQMLDEEVERMMALPEDERTNELVLRIETLPVDHRAMVMAFLRANLDPEDN